MIHLYLSSHQLLRQSFIVPSVKINNTELAATNPQQVDLPYLFWQQEREVWHTKPRYVYPQSFVKPPEHLQVLLSKYFVVKVEMMLKVCKRYAQGDI